MSSGLPRSIDLGGRRLRAWRLEDQDLITAAIERNRGHLHDYMGWSDTANAEQNRAFLQMAVDGRISGRDFLYAITSPAGDEIWGSIGLHHRGVPGRVEIGYWVDRDHLRQGHAAAASAALAELALAELPWVRQVEIHCDVSNRASAAVPRHLGFRLDRVAAAPLQAPADTGLSMVWIRERPVPRGRPR